MSFIYKNVYIICKRKSYINVMATFFIEILYLVIHSILVYIYYSIYNILYLVVHVCITVVNTYL